MRVPLGGGLADAFVAERIRRAPLDEAAFTDFYARTAGPLGGYLRRLTGNTAVAEDLVQEAYLRFLSLTRVPDTDDHRRNYLFRIGTNLARDFFRGAQRDLGFREKSRAEPEARPGASWQGADSPFDGGELRGVLARLSTRDRELLLLAYVEGLTHKEIGAITGLMCASIKPLLFRARRRFATAMREAGITPASLAEAVS